MTRTSHIPELAAPSLAPFQNNGINLAAAAHLLVNVPPYPDMDSGDLIELFWNNCYVASHLLKEQDVAAPVSLKVPESFIASGSSRIHYRVMRVGHGPSLSEAARITVKLDCPGGQPPAVCGDENQQLAPVTLPDTIRRQGVNANQIRRGVPLTIEPYLNMADGDAITLRWGDVRMDLAHITPADVGKPIQVWVPPAIITEAGEDLRLDVTYCILDRVGNNSRWAPPRTLKIGCVNPYLKVPLRETLKAAEPQKK